MGPSLSLGAWFPNYELHYPCFAAINPENSSGFYLEVPQLHEVLHLAIHRATCASGALWLSPA